MGKAPRKSAEGLRAEEAGESQGRPVIGRIGSGNFPAKAG